MRRWLLTAGLVLMMTAMSGCIVIDTETTEVCRTTVVEPAGVTTSEIDAVGQLSVEDHRRDGYKRIAHRRGLSTDVQVHLIEAAFGNLSRDDAKVDVLVTLIRNRCFRPEAKAAILDRLGGLSREDSRREILDALSRK